jgi:hypothetical protein
VTSNSLRLAAAGCAAGAAAVSAAGVVLAAGIPGYFPAFVDGHLLVNATIGVAYALIGGCVAWARRGTRSGGCSSFRGGAAAR